jgi:Tfp pilus assembly protein PilF
MTRPEIQAALAALGQKRNAEAQALLQAAGADLADDPLAMQVWSLAVGELGQRAAALAAQERAARLAPDDAQAQFNYGVLLQQAQDLPAAIARYAQALRLAPDHRGALNNLSDLYRRRGRSAEGYALMARYLGGGGDARGLELRLAKLALDTRRWDEAEHWFSAAAQAQPDDAQIAFEHAMLALLREDWARGWLLYEARLRVHGGPGLAMHTYPRPPWDGAAPGRVLIHREQGLGDAIMFASAVPDMIAAGVTLHLAQAPSLQRLFAASFPGAQVWSSVTMAGVAEQPLQPFLRVCGPLDAQAPICSLGALRMADGPPLKRAYLRAPAEEMAVWKQRLDALAPPRAGVRRIGLCFAARRPTFSADGLTNGELKSIPAAALAPLAEVSNVQWISLHDPSTAALFADALGLDCVDLSPWITDFADTAAAIAHLDLVVTVDTAVAHLAGALGAPTWLMLRRQADWRWGVDRDDAVWYSDMRCFRQKQAGDWAAVLAAVAQALR